MTNKLNTLFNVFVLVLQWESKQISGTRTETWNALLHTTSTLSRIKNNTKPVILKPNAKRIDVIPDAKKSRLESLPAELLMMIMEHITDQKTLYQLSQVNRRWYRYIKHKLFVNPYLTSPKSILGFVNGLDETTRLNVERIEFGPTRFGCLLDPLVTKDQFEFIPYVHSGLFRLLIHDRDTSNTTDHLVHPLFYQLAQLVPNCTGFDEFGYHKETMGEPVRKDVVENRTFYTSRIPSSSLNLTFLLRACQKWFNDFPEWDGLKESIPDAMSTCILLLEWLQGTYHPIWHRVGSDSARVIKPLVNSLVRNFLGYVYSTLLLQVRFITSNSQRLLDCYCLIYYRVLSIAQNLDIHGLAEAMGCPKLGERNEVSTSEFLLLEQHARDLELNPPVDPPTPKSVRSSIESIGLSNNQDAARSIYECLVLIFHFRIPANLHSSKTFPRVPIELLKEILITFPPSSINAETIELISFLLQHNLDMEDPTTPLLLSWFKWLKEIVLWHEASREMDPVKDLLRKSMAKIDELRTVQVFLVDVASIRSCLYGIIYYNETPVFLKFRITTINFTWTFPMD
jgi:hypothetical protein